MAEDADVAGGTVEAPRVVTPDLLRSWPLPDPTGTKYARGQVLVVGGSATTPGAAVLAGTAALRMGAGRLTVATADGVAVPMAVAFPECGTVPLPQDDQGAITGEGARDLLDSEIARADALLLGPGLRGGPGAEHLLAQVARDLPRSLPVVLDAAALTALPTLDPTTTRGLGGRLVLTPNAQEIAALVEESDVADDELAAATLRVSGDLDAVVGCARWVASEGRLWQVSTGDTGLGTSGSGDVVAGAVAGLLARGATPVQAMVWAKHVHAAAGDVLAARWGRVGFLATEVLPELPLVLRSLGGD